MFNVIGRIEEGGRNAGKYILFDNETNETIAKSPSECHELAFNGKLIGLTLNGNSIRASKFHRWKGAVGKDQPEVYTVVERIVDIDGISYKLSDRVGNTQVVTSEALEEMINSGEKINGVRMRESGLMIEKKIPSKIVRNKEVNTCTT